MAELNQKRAFIATMLEDLHAAFNTPLPDEQGWAEKLSAWNNVMADATPGEIPALTNYIVRHHDNGFLPSAGQGFALWQKFNGITQGEVANSAAYQRFDSRRETLYALPANSGQHGAQAARLNLERNGAGLLNVTCDCVNHTARDGYRYFETAVLSPDGKHWVCYQGACKFVMPVDQTMDAPSKGKVSPAFEGGMPGFDVPKAVLEAQCDYSDLLPALVEFCNFRTEGLPDGAAIDFARHLSEKTITANWTADLARDEWPVWFEASGFRFEWSQVAA